MIGGSKKSGESTTSKKLAISPDSDLIVGPADLRPGDVLLFRPRKTNRIQSSIARATGSPYTHAAIYLGDGMIAESVVRRGVSSSALRDLIDSSLCVAVLRSSMGFGDERVRKLMAFVTSVLGNRKFYNFVSALSFGKRSAEHFETQLDFIRQNYGKVISEQEFAKKSFFCSAFVVACFAVVGIIGETAQVAYQPDYFSPRHLGEDPTFGWLLGFLVPEGGAVPDDDPLPSQATLWRDCQDVRWW